MSGTAPRLRRAFDSPSAKRSYVRRLFSTIAARYDLITVVLSYGQDRRWKRRLVGMAAPAEGVHALDVACGTGDIALQMAGRGARVTGLDLTPEMLALARRKGPVTNWVNGDIMALPFGDEQFDVVTAGYGLRNVPELRPALSEIRRVLKPGGVFLSLDFDRPAHPAVRTIYLGYLTIVGGVLGLLLHGRSETYRYIPASILRYPGGLGVAELMRAQGFRDCEQVPLLFGLMAIHRAVR